MNKYLIIFSFAQNNHENNIKKDLNAFLNGIESKQMDKALNQIYPKYFKIVSKEQMKQILNMTYNNPAVFILNLGKKM